MDYSEVDPILLTLMEMVEQRARDAKPIKEVRLVLQVGGIMVSGELISHQEFSADGYWILDNIKGWHKDTLSEMAIEFNVPLKDAAGDPPVFIHLKGVEFWRPGSPAEPIPSKALWRGRLDRVDAFCINQTFGHPNQLI